MKSIRNLTIFAAFTTLASFAACGQTAAGANFGNGQQTRGISYVTRRVPMAVPNQIAGGYFAAAGVPVGGVGFGNPGNPGNFGGQVIGGARLAQVQAVNPAPEAEVASEALTPQARQMLQRLARSGNAEARAALAEYSAPAIPQTAPEVE